MNFDPTNVIYRNFNYINPLEAEDRVHFLTEGHFKLDLLNGEVEVLLQEFAQLEFDVVGQRINTLLDRWFAIGDILGYHDPVYMPHFLEGTTKFQFFHLKLKLLKARHASLERSRNDVWKTLHDATLQLTLTSQSFLFVKGFIAEQLNRQRAQNQALRNRIR